MSGAPVTAPGTALGAAPRTVDRYRAELGWPVAERADGSVDLLTGTSFDALEMPLGAGRAVLRRLGPGGTGPVAAWDSRAYFLVAPGGAADLPGLLEWLEWGGIALDIVAHGPGGRLRAPQMPFRECRESREFQECLESRQFQEFTETGEPRERWPAGRRRAADERWEAADRILPVWLRPPSPGSDAALPVLGVPGTRSAQSPDLARLVVAAANACHRARLFPAVPPYGAAERADGHPDDQAWALS
ncbi:SCO3374 family protein [Wenjunlia tyrosinilytica]|uniref:SCO3374 family protein n=1 Tax=Wenjunlia tyrosinilytica TaxID=1544741 RepID=UPI00166B12CB|nr:SCO3374 family protein [Wenjunlia tyrosinilytica]